MDPLAALKDIHLPGIIGWWPPAIGWWLLLLLMLVVILLVLVSIRRRWERMAPYRIAMKEFDRITEDYQLQKDSIKLSQQLSILLRRIAISIAARKEVAGLTGELWLEYLDKLSGQTILCSDTGRQLLQAPYRADVTVDGDALLATCEQWISAVSRYRG
jgi:hypothetical protein